MTPIRSRTRVELLVPALTIASAVLLVARFAFGSDTFQHCQYLGPSTRVYVTGWAGPVCSLVALVLYWALLRRVNAVTPGRLVPGDSGGARLAAAFALVALFLLLVQALALYWVYAPDQAGGDGCEGPAVLRASLAA
ncbi:hypothetical protein [Streptomyces beihaiensis]|uniref:Uncharacterized protein n=1 Tax=Streptomyces beihaiensis TaxID=2984495 RepID=A0ABT3TXJ6_9ACTN|nr:hypothetical protein [Streptomyces beihaiensis]MCX3061777.1 hypothetical protein [Streptomyces beihaiensis]